MRNAKPHELFSNKYVCQIIIVQFPLSYCKYKSESQLMSLLKPLSLFRSRNAKDE